MRDIPDKDPGDQYFSGECTDMFSEEENLITNTGIALSSGDLSQMSKSVSNYVASGDYYNESGVTNAYVIAPLSTKQAPTAYVEGMRVRFYPGNDNDGPSTINVNSLGIKAITNIDGTALSGDEIVVNAEITLAYDGTNFRITSASHTDIAISMSQKFRGCILLNDDTDPDKDLDFGLGFFRADNADLIFRNPHTLVKQIDAAWAEGTNQGGRTGGALAEGWWHNFYIAKPDGTVDAGWDKDITAINLLTAATGYKYYARRTSTYVTSDPIIQPFYNKGNDFWWNGIPFTITSIPGIPAPVTIVVPIGVVTEAKLNVGVEYSGGQDGGIFHSSILAPNTNRETLRTATGAGARNYLEILADTNGQIEHNYTGFSPAAYEINTLGYKEFYD